MNLKLYIYYKNNCTFDILNTKEKITNFNNKYLYMKFTIFKNIKY